MKKIRKIAHYIIDNPEYLLIILLTKVSLCVPDKLYLKLMFRLKMGYWMDFDNPKTFQEKLQWLKLYNRRPEYTQMVDKFAVKEYVANIIGKEYIIPTLGVWNKFDDIDFDSLPNQFVLKTTHSGGNTGVVVCKDKSTLDIELARKKLDRSLKQCIYKSLKEWPYKGVKHRIIAEEFIEFGSSDDIPDYKFYCFDGTPRYCQVIRDRNKKETIDFYDMDWNHIPLIGLNPVVIGKSVLSFQNGTTRVERPKNLESIIRICGALTTGIPFSRIDMYIVDDKIYFGEITFFPASGFGCFEPMEWDVILGDLITLP